MHLLTAVTWSEIAAAVGTFTLAGVAVGVPYADRRRVQRLRPRLIIDFGPDAESDVRMRLEAGGGVSAYLVTFRVSNRGGTAARGVRAHLRDYVAAISTAVSGKTAVHRAMDPQPLAWSSRPAALGPELREHVVIPAGMTDVAMAARFEVSDKQLTVPPLTGEPFGPRLPQTPMVVGHWLVVTVTADNAEPASAVLWFETPHEGDRRSRVTAVELNRPLPEAATVLEYAAIDDPPDPAVALQARQVSIWVDDVEDTGSNLIISYIAQNASGDPIYQVDARLPTGTQGTFVRYLGMMGPVEKRRVRVMVGRAQPVGDKSPEIIFADSNDRHWHRGRRGLLRQVAGAEEAELRQPAAGAFGALEANPYLHQLPPDEPGRGTKIG
jgi:hypothetical protein